MTEVAELANLQHAEHVDNKHPNPDQYDIPINKNEASPLKGGASG